jgi:U4/U6 small nuclear ribonucleoprotein PRP31
VDSYQSSIAFIAGPTDTEGVALRKEVEEKIEKLLEPSKARTKKALPIPEEKKKSKRGGKRVRKMKERFQVTEMQKMKNKMEFTTSGGEYGDSAMGFDSGMLGSKVLIY